MSGAKRGLVIVVATATVAAAACARRDDSPRHDAGASASASARPPARTPPRSNPLPPGVAWARAFVFNRDPRVSFCTDVLMADGAICRSAEGQGVALSRGQLERLIDAFTAPPREPDTAPLCFAPHHGIVLYDAADKSVAGMSICFECEREALWPRPRDGTYDTQPLSGAAEKALRHLLCEELGLVPCGRVGE